MDGFKWDVDGMARGPLPARKRPPCRGLHSFTSQLNLSALYRIRGARRGFVARGKGVAGGVQGVLFSCDRHDSSCAGK
jgi:hypothetical protein